MSEVTVVIPNYKGKKYLCACVDSLFKSTKMELSVIIVDNASEDGSIDEVNSCIRRFAVLCWIKITGSAER